MGMHRIAIVAWGAMADILYATPIVRHIRLINPDAHITWLLRDKFAEVIETNLDIDAIRTFTLPDHHESRQHAEYAMDQEILVCAKGEFDSYYDLQYWPRYSNFFERQAEDFISLRARNAGIDPTVIVDRHIALHITADDTACAQEFLRSEMARWQERHFITVNHISYAASPVWPFANYSALVDILSHEYGVSSIFTGAPNEPIPANVYDARGMPYRTWASLINMSSLWLGLDSGAVALACAGETPIIKLHSPDFPLAKTGIKPMGLRTEGVLELCPAPNPETMAELIMENMR